MIRPGSTILAILLFSLPSQAQVPGGTEREHTVRSGESLTGIANAYYDSASEWERIFEANRTRLDDPDQLQVGIVLVIPGLAATEPRSAGVTGVQVSASGTMDQDASSFEARRALLQSRPFEPVGVPDVPFGDRSVFFDLPEPEMQAAIVVLQVADEIPALAPSIFNAAGWLVREEDENRRLGEIVGFADGRTVGAGSDTSQLYENVRIGLAVEDSPETGDEFLVYSVERNVRELGGIAAPTGRARVIEVGDRDVIAEIVQAFGRVQIGHLVTRARTFPLSPGVHPIEVSSSVERESLRCKMRRSSISRGTSPSSMAAETEG